MIKIKTEHELNLTVFTVIGEVSIDEIITTLKNFYLGVTTKLTLWDFSEGTASKLSRDDIRVLVGLSKRRADVRREGKTAIVAPSTLDYGLGRMLEIFADIEDLQFEISTFHSLDEAKEWLKL